MEIFADMNLNDVFTKKNRIKADKMLLKINKIFKDNLTNVKVSEAYAVGGFIVAQLFANLCITMFDDEKERDLFMEVIIEATLAFIKIDMSSKDRMKKTH